MSYKPTKSKLLNSSVSLATSAYLLVVLLLPQQQLPPLMTFSSRGPPYRFIGSTYDQFCCLPATSALLPIASAPAHAIFNLPAPKSYVRLRSPMSTDFSNFPFGSLLHHQHTEESQENKRGKGKRRTACKSVLARLRSSR